MKYANNVTFVSTFNPTALSHSHFLSPSITEFKSRNPLPTPSVPATTTIYRRVTPVAKQQLPKALSKVVLAKLPTLVPQSHICLPQHEGEQRADKIEDQKEIFEWTKTTKIPGASFIDNIPLSELPSPQWFVSLITIVLEVLDNTVAVAGAEQAGHETAEIAQQTRFKLLELAKRAQELAQSPKDVDSVEKEVLDILHGIKSCFQDVLESTSANDSSGVLASAAENGNGSPTVHANGSSLFTTHLSRDQESETEASTDPLQKWKDQFRKIEAGVSANGNQFQEDALFGWFRVAGPNPMRLTNLQKFHTGLHQLFPELNNEIFQGVEGFQHDKLNHALTEGRLFVVDYSDLAQFSDCSLEKDSNMYAPICLLAVPKTGPQLPHLLLEKPKAQVSRSGLLPIAIRTGQLSSKPSVGQTTTTDLPLFTANSSHTDGMAWTAAKNVVQVADTVTHETLYHLSRTHCLMEVFTVATKRALSHRHPLYVLLNAHMHDTVFINYLSSHALMAEGGPIDQLVAAPLEEVAQYVANGVASPDFSFNDWMPDIEFNNRGVTDEYTLAYPYRDDALQLWAAIHEWVHEYIMHYYGSNDDVRDDPELNDWVREIVSVDKGNLHGFGQNKNSEIKSRWYLTRCVSMILFTATVQHAAMNSPQGDLMQFSPAFPLAAYDSAPTDPAQAPYASEQDMADAMYPPTTGDNEAYNQTALTYVLGSVMDKALGQYGIDLITAPARVKVALRAFQRRLEKIEEEIRKRNEEEYAQNLPPYVYLRPSQIPNSLNI